MVTIGRVLKFSFFVWAYGLGSNLFALPSQIIVVPSAEQSNNVLTIKGQQRAMALSPYLSSGEGPFSALFACKPTTFSSSLASMQTFIPLGQNLALPVRMPHGVGQENEMAALVLSYPQYDQQRIAIVWQVNDLSALFTSLGYTNLTAEDSSAYIYILPYPIGTATKVPQKLLFDDPS